MKICFVLFRAGLLLDKIAAAGQEVTTEHQLVMLHSIPGVDMDRHISRSGKMV